jgi:hypothetical protein
VTLIVVIGLTIILFDNLVCNNVGCITNFFSFNINTTSI